MIKAGIIGATGYAGAELVKLLTRHPQTEIVALGSKSYTGETFSDIYGNFRSFLDVPCDSGDLLELSKKADVIFTATPQGYLSNLLTEEILSNTKIIDLSADYRLKDVNVYEQWYNLKHGSPHFLDEAVYGLCELHRDMIKPARLIANPGCYTTCSILSLYPLVAEGLIDPSTIIIDAKSGTSGAGRGAKTPNLFCEVNENIKAYGVTTHRHTPEIEAELSLASGNKVTLNFTPHLVPMNRGILVTAYADVLNEADEKTLRAAYNKYYDSERFIRILPAKTAPETRWVEGSNYVDINVIKDERTNRAVIMGALDNLVKGAAGQAVQNMNLLFGLDEVMGLDIVPLFP